MPSVTQWHLTLNAESQLEGRGSVWAMWGRLGGPFFQVNEYRKECLISERWKVRNEWQSLTQDVKELIKGLT